MNKKLKIFLNNYILEYMDSVHGFYSSAQILESDLAKLGIRFPKKLWFKYKLPDGIKHEKYELEITKMLTFCLFKPMKEQIQQGLCEQKNLTDEELETIDNYILSQRPKYLEMLDTHFNFIKENNTELSNIKIPNDISSKLEFLYGTVYGFSPEEISYFINRSDEQAESDFNEQEQLRVVLDMIGVRLGYILCPDNRALLQKQVNEYLTKKNQGKENL